MSYEVRSLLFYSFRSPMDRFEHHCGGVVTGGVD